ncbi:hypothetical protein Chor_016693 [Crotalus horridus]
MLPVKWMPPEAFLEGIFTSKTDTCYRIMTQCWQHSPEYRPNFSTILERIKYCTQDPDVIHTELPIECSPTPEDEGSTVLHTNSNTGIVPLLGNQCPQINHQAFEEHDSGNKYGQCPQELLVENLSNWRAEVPRFHYSSSGAWAQPVLTQNLDSTSQSAHKLKNKTKNLWNPTYGSWVMENNCQSSPRSKLNTMQEREDSGFDGNYSPSPSSRTSPSSPSQNHSPHIDIGGIELVKLQSFPCGNVNYAYDDLCYEIGHPSPLAAEPATVMRSGSLPGDSNLVFKTEKTSRERDSGLSLSGDLNVTPI